MFGRLGSRSSHFCSSQILVLHQVSERKGTASAIVVGEGPGTRLFHFPGQSCALPQGHSVSIVACFYSHREFNTCPHSSWITSHRKKVSCILLSFCFYHMDQLGQKAYFLQDLPGGQKWYLASSFVGPKLLKHWKSYSLKPLSSPFSTLHPSPVPWPLPRTS